MLSIPIATAPTSQSTMLREQYSAAMLSCGVAMCTYNAGAFLQPQLDSIAMQTRRLAHVVVSDDRSVDGTWERLCAWAAEMESKGIMRVTLFRNDERLGVLRNFEQSIRALDTDIIFLSDQDDVWTHGKVETIAGVFESSPSALLVHSDALLIDERGKDMGKSLFQALKLSPAEEALVVRRRYFEIYCRRNLVTGTTAAFRRELLDLALPFPDDWIHDEWLAACAAARGEVAMLSDKLTAYRQHGANVIGIPVTAVSRLTRYARRVAQTPRDDYLRFKLRRLEALGNRLASYSPAISADKLALLGEAQSHFARRLKFRRSLFPRLFAVVRECRRHGYHRFADGIAGMVRDLIHV
ncbi:glycosyltransferase family 2 protein [Cupriavidus necator]|uniref:glycosyltransferase family 2 protein n=1 Tax=Cupriavidus necator TaxID=106590 RepID=UPI0009BFD134|nr:glycosyltransferase family 2 protein [Cupriavidus necator]